MGHNSTMKKIVADGYDQIADTYASWSLRVDDPVKLRFAQIALDSFPEGGALIDLGCGTGEHVTALLHPHFDVVAVDVSPVSIELARERVPGPDYRVADMTALELPAGSVDVVTAFFSLIHVPRDEHAALLGRIARWLRPGGMLIATMGAWAKESYVDDWLGAPMAWSQWDAETNQGLVRDAGFDLISAEEVFEADEPFSHLWVVAQARG